MAEHIDNLMKYIVTLYSRIIGRFKWRFKHTKRMSIIVFLLYSLLVCGAAWGIGLLISLYIQSGVDDRLMRRIELSTQSVSSHLSVRDTWLDNHTVSTHMIVSGSMAGIPMTGSRGCAMFLSTFSCIFDTTVDSQSSRYVIHSSGGFVTVIYSGIDTYHTYTGLLLSPQQEIFPVSLYTGLSLLLQDSKHERFKKDEGFFYGQLGGEKKLDIKNILNNDFLNYITPFVDTSYNGVISSLMSRIDGVLNISYTLEDMIQDDDQIPFSLLSLYVRPDIFFDKQLISGLDNVFTDVGIYSDGMFAGINTDITVYHYPSSKHIIQLGNNIKDNTIILRGDRNHYGNSNTEKESSAHYANFGYSYSFGETTYPTISDTFSGSFYRFIPLGDAPYQSIPDESLRGYVYQIGFTGHTFYESGNTIQSIKLP